MKGCTLHRDQSVIHRGMLYESIQGQGYKTFVVRHSPFFKDIAYLQHLEAGKCSRAKCFTFVVVFLSRNFEEHYRV